MRKMLFGIACILMTCSFISCNKITEMKVDTVSVKSVNEVANSIAVADEVPNVKSGEQIFSTKSDDESIAINITTTKDNYENIIKEISVINNSVTLNTIDNIIGYYDNVTMDTSSVAILNYHGRKWSDFILLDTTNGQLLFYEPFGFDEIKSSYQDNDMMDYDINENDVFAFSCDKILDKDTIIISYQIHDMNGNLQSGNFKYIISKNKFENLQENKSIPEG